MKRFIVSILPFVSLAVRTLSADRAKLTGVKLLTRKQIALLLIVTFFFTVKSFSQTSSDGLLKIDSCFLAMKMNHKTKRISISKTFCVGDKITVKLGGNKIHGKIGKLSKNYIVMANNNEIDVRKIEWIKKTKLTADRVIGGTLVTAVGIALFAASTQIDDFDDFDDKVILALTGTALVPIGIIIFVSRPKFQIEKGDKLIFGDAHVAKQQL